jgi:hypothetical protein
VGDTGLSELVGDPPGEAATANGDEVGSTADGDVVCSAADRAGAWAAEQPDIASPAATSKAT